MKILDPKALKKKIHFVPHPDQTLVLANMKRFTVLNCGRRRAILGNLTGKKVSTAWQENEAIKNLNPDEMRQYQQDLVTPPKVEGLITPEEEQEQEKKFYRAS